jgi:hypothetical protein
VISSEHGNDCSASSQGILTEYRSSCQGEPHVLELQVLPYFIILLPRSFFVMWNCVLWSGLL